MVEYVSYFQVGVFYVFLLAVGAAVGYFYCKGKV
jgi:hypothetical protein